MLRTFLSLGILVVLLAGSLWVVHEVDQLDEPVPSSIPARPSAPAPSPAPDERENAAPRPTLSSAAERPMALHAEAPTKRTVSGAHPGGASVSGVVRVRRAGGAEPLPRATVQLALESGDVLKALSGADGSFRFEELPAGPAALSARGEHEPECEPRYLSLEDGATHEGLTLELVAGARLEGELAPDVPNRPNRRVVARPLEGLDRWIADVDETGRFTFYLAPGTYRVFLDWSPDAGGPADFVQAYAQRAEKLVEVGPTGVTRTVLGDPDPDAVTVNGRVLSGGRPVAGIVLHVLPEEGSRPLTMARTEQDGSFQVTIPAPRAVRFAVGEEPSTQVLFPVVIDAGANEPVTLRLAAGSLAGRVLAPDGSGVANRSVLVTPVEEPTGSRALGVVRRTRTDELGNWGVSFLPAGSYRVRFGGIGGVDPSDPYGVRVLPDVSLAEGEARAGVRVTLPTAAAVSVRVEDRAGRPVAGAAVRALDANGLEERIWAPEVRTDAEGRAELGGLGTGRLTILAEEGGRRARERVPLAAGGRADVVLRLP